MTLEVYDPSTRKNAAEAYRTARSATRNPDLAPPTWPIRLTHELRGVIARIGGQIAAKIIPDAGDEDLGVIGVSFDADGEREYGWYHVVKHADGSLTARPYDDEEHLA